MEAQEELDKLSPAIEFQDKIYHRLVKIAGGEESLDDLEDACETLAKDDDSLNAFDLKRKMYAAGLTNLGAYPWAESVRGKELFYRLVDHIEDIIEFSGPWNSRMCALFVMQSYFYYDLFPIVFYLGFKSAQYGAAKTTATRIVTELCKGGFMVGNTTGPYLERKMDAGEFTLGVDELDALQKDIRSVIEKSLRHGYERDALSGKVDDVENGKHTKKEAVEFNIFGPKAVNMRKDIDEALASRTYIIEMARVREEDRAKRVLNIMAHQLDTGPRDILIADLEILAEKKLEIWHRSDVVDLLRSAEFLFKLQSVEKQGAAPRDTQLAAMILLIGEIIEIDIIEELMEATKSQQDYRGDERLEEFCEMFMEVWGELGEPPIALKSELVSGLNEKRKARGYRGLTMATMTNFLVDAGLKKGKGKDIHYGTSGKYKKKACVLFTGGEGGSIFRLAPMSPPEEVKNLLSFGKSPLSGGIQWTESSTVESSEERVELYIYICKEVINISADNSYTLEKISTSPLFKKLGTEKVSAEHFAEKITEKFRAKGRVWGTEKGYQLSY